MRKDIRELFQFKCWEQIAFTHSVYEVVRVLPFKDAMRLAFRLLYNHTMDDQLREYAVTMLKAMRTFFSEEWNSSWRYEAFLGIACDITSHFDDRYLAYKRAFEKVSPPPPELLIELARCCNCPGEPPITYDEAIALVQEAIKDYPYIDGVSLLRSIYASKRDEEKEKYWKAKLTELGDKGIQSPSLEPEFLVEEATEMAKESE